MLARKLSRGVYRTVYVLLYLVLIGLLLITPGDAIRRSLDNGQRYNVLILAVCYVATIVVVLFVYVLRLYINKTALAAIPKGWVPIDKGDVKDPVYRMIGTGLQRSAAITYLSRPRDVVDDIGDAARRHPDTTYLRPRLTARTPDIIGQELGIKLPRQDVLWGKIEQPGWSSPNSDDLPNLQYSTVLSELPNLIEAKAMTLAPPDAESTPEQPLLNAEVTELLQRDVTQTVRQYLEYLAELGVIEMDTTTIDFLSQYEHARFSSKPISNTRFRDLMHLFAELLRTMTTPDLDYIPQEHGLSSSDIDSDAPGTTPRSHLTRTMTSSTRDSSRHRSPMRRRSQYATAPNTPGSRHTVDMLTRQRSNNSFVTTGTQSIRRGRAPPPRSQPSNASLQSAATSNSGSVIRLASRDDRGELPYVMAMRSTGQ